MKFTVVADYNEMSALAAGEILSMLKEKPNLTLGLATGSTPIGLYNFLAEAYAGGEADFSAAHSFNLDEYYPIKKDNDQSYDYFMRKHLFDRINLPKEHRHIPNGEAADPAAETAAYEKMLGEHGYTDVQILGIGQNGHIGFNEPDTFMYADTHMTGLTESTIRANARFFASEADVPTHALTMGIGSILKSKKILLLACGKEKHAAIEALKDGKVTPDVPATFLKLHPDVEVICDTAAFGE